MDAPEKDIAPATASLAPEAKPLYMPTPKLWTSNSILKGALILMGVILIIAWILMMFAAKELSGARKAGAWSRELCGYEFMEAETERYKLAEAYQKSAKKLIYAALAMFVGLGALAMLTMTGFSLETFIVALRKGTTYNVPEKSVPVFLQGIIFVIILMLLSQSTTLITRFGQILNQKSYNEAVTVADANEEIKKQNPLLIQSVVLGTLTSLGLLFAAYKFVATEDTGANGISFPKMPSLGYLSLVVLIFIVGGTLSLVLTKYYTLLNAQFSDYNTKTGELNTAIKDILTEEGTMGLTNDYISRNIKRLDPKADVEIADALTVNYPDSLYAYVFHADGDEMNHLDKKTIRADEAKRIFETIKSELNTLIPNVDNRKEYTSAIDSAYVAVLASLSTFVAEPTITESLLKSAIDTPIAKLKTQTSIKLNDAMRYDLGNILNADDPIKVSSLRESIKKVVETYAQSAVKMTHADMMAAIEEKVIGKVFAGKTGTDLDNLEIGKFKDDTRRQAILNSFADGRENGLDDVILKTSVSDFIKDRISALVTIILATTETKLDVRTKLRNLRNSQVTQEADTFVRTMFIASVVIAVLFAYGIFHYFYKRAPDLVTLVSAGLILVLVLALSFYGWFMGQTII